MLRLHLRVCHTIGLLFLVHWDVYTAQSQQYKRIEIWQMCVF